MPGRTEPGRQRGRLGRSVVLLAAATWLLLLVLLGMGVGAAQVVAASPNPTGPLGTCVPTCTPTSPASPTTTVVTSTPTATVAGTVTPTKAASTVTPTATTATGGGGGGGGDQGGGGSGNQSGGPQPTKVVLSQPTVGSGSDSPLASLSPAALGSNGLLIATSLSCVVAILGLIVAAVAIYVLINGGYGPFLRALVLGKRAGRSKGQNKGRGARAGEAAYENGWDDGGWERSGAYEFDDSAEYRAAQPPQPRTQGRNSGGRNSGPRDNSSNGGYGGTGGYEGSRSGPQQRAPARSTRNLREW